MKCGGRPHHGRTLARLVPVVHMKVAGVLLDDFEYMRDLAHAQKSWT